MLTLLPTSPVSGGISFSTGEAAGHWSDMRGNVSLSGGNIQALASGDIELFSGSDDKGSAGDISIVTGSSSQGRGGHINIIASSNQHSYDPRVRMMHHHQEIYPTEINFGFDEYSPIEFEGRKIALQLKQTKDSTR